MSVATENFLAAWRMKQRTGILLLELEVARLDGSGTDTARLATSEVITPKSADESVPARLWRYGVERIESLNAPGQFMETEVQLATCTLVLANRVLPFQSADATSLFSTLATHQWQGAIASLYLWEASLTQWDDVCPQMVRATVETAGRDGDGLTLVLRQAAGWNRQVVPRVCTRAAYPHAPEDSVGQPLPIVYGALTDVSLRPPWPAYPTVYGNFTPEIPTRNYGVSQVFGGRRVGRAVLVDTGRGQGAVVNPKAKVLVACHPCKSINDFARGVGLYMKAGDRLASILPNAPSDVVNTATEAGMLLGDNDTQGLMSVFPTDVKVVSNTAENPRAVLDPFNDFNYAKFDWTAGYRTLRMRFSGLDNLGELWPADGSSRGICAFYGYRAPNATNLKLRWRVISHPTSYYDISLAQRSSPRAEYTFVNTTWISSPWDFSDWELEFGWPTSTEGGSPVISGTGSAELFFIGFMVYFIPRQFIIESEKVFTHTEYRPVSGPPRRHSRGNPYTADTQPWSYRPTAVQEIIPAITELRGKFFANIEGWQDDGSGTFTGTALALIERAPDIVTHLLNNYAGVSLDDIERESSAFGSFVRARTLLKTWKRQDWRFAFCIADTADVSTLLSRLAHGSASWLFVDRFTGKWRCLPWRDNASDYYDRTFIPSDLMEPRGPEWELLPRARISTGLRVGYGYDHLSGNTLHLTSANYEGSQAGHRYRNLRDECATVVADANDRFDFAIDTYDRTVSLTPGAYADPMGLAQHLAAQANAVIIPSWNFLGMVVNYGPRIVAGYNDALLVQLGDATYKVLTIPAADYSSYEALCYVVQFVLNANFPGYTWTVTYNRTTRRVTFSVIGPVLPPFNVVARFPLIADYATRSVLTVLGMAMIPPYPTYIRDFTTSGASYECEDDREEETYSISLTSTNGWNFLSLLWETGTNGLKSGTGLKNCAELFGFDTLRDDGYLGNVLYSTFCADAPKGARETALLQAAQRYAPKKDANEDTRVIADDDTARALRNSVLDLTCKPRLTITFSTNMAPDMERGRIVKFSGDFDALQPYPLPDSDGTWLGKRFVVVEVEQMLGPVAFYTRVRAVSLD